MADGELNRELNHFLFDPPSNPHLLEGKRTVMLIRLFEISNPDERARIAQILETPRTERTLKSTRWLQTAMERGGCIDYAREMAHGLAGAATAGR